MHWKFSSGSLERVDCSDTYCIVECCNLLVSVQCVPIEELDAWAPRWLNDDVTRVCMICFVEFTRPYRKHHCRACGAVSIIAQIEHWVLIA